jgi:phospholipid/cholesterol/gamma-HCH transport system substrate-binding protein
MTERTLHIRVGAVILIAVGVFIASFLWVEDLQWRKQMATLQVVFHEVGSLTRGDVVSVSGIEKGTVKDVQLADEGVLVTLELERDVTLKRDAAASIRSIGIMGEKFVFIDPGSAAEGHDWSKPLHGQYELGMGEVFSTIGITLTSMQVLAVKIDRLLGIVEERGGVAEGVENLKAFSAHLKSFAEESSDDLEVAIRDIRYGSSYLRNVIETQGSQITETIATFDSTSTTLAHAVAQFDTLSTTLNSISRRLEAGEGSAGLLLQDEELYLELTEAIKNMNLLIEDIRKDPGKYFKVEIF